MSECPYDNEIECNADLTYVECHTCIMFRIFKTLRALVREISLASARSQ